MIHPNWLRVEPYPTRKVRPKRLQRSIARVIACIPKSVPLIARLEHPRAGAGGHNVVPKQSAQGSFEHIGILVLPTMAVERSRESARSEGVVHDREAPLGVGSVDLPMNTDASQVELIAGI